MIQYINDKGNIVVQICESSHGGYVLQIGAMINETENPCGLGYIMGGFMPYISTHCNSIKEAKSLLKYHLKNAKTVYTFHLNKLEEING
jgi:hypothetical protein